ncbi:MAG TPA: glycoside hydrolase family 76 protein [Chloroflexota bacterium]|nr:glycoside hydrolase family 76 protein [Chloroflexota bacterium]
MSWRLAPFGLAALFALSTAASGAGLAQSETNDAGEASARLAAAATIQGATRARLGVLGDAFACPDARFASFRRSDAEPQFADQWYVASQLWADAVLLRVAEPQPEGWDAQDSRCYLDKGFVFLDRLWDYASAGYFPRADPVGGNVESGTRFTDDNLIAGLALLDTARTTADPYSVRRYIHAARREADFLLQESTGLWDTTFGGGFWWNTGRGDSAEGKPAQTNALAALFFGRLYAATGEATYRDWAVRSLLWLDTLLYDPGRHLYRWSVSFQDLPRRGGAVISQRYFNYDQSIAIEAQLAVMQLDNDQNRLARARDVGRATQATFWSAELGGYNLEAGIDQVFTSYGAWTSLGHLALYDRDQDRFWLDLARANIQALESRLHESDNGFAYRAYRCIDRIATGCQSGQAVSVIDHTRDTAAQAWVQHLQAGLAEQQTTSTVTWEGGAGRRGR